MSSDGALVDLGQGIFSTPDLQHSVADWCEPLRLEVWGHRLWTVPPPSQGYLTLASSRVAEHLGIGSDPSDPLWAHLVVEASRAAGYDRPTVLHDGADGQALLADDRLRVGAGRVRADRTAAARRRAAPGCGSRHPGPPPGRRGHHPSVRHRCRRSGYLAHPVQRARLRIPSRRRDDRDLPPQSRGGLLPRGGSSGRARSWPQAASHAVPDARHHARRIAHPSGRGHGRRRPAPDPPAAPGPDAPGRPGSLDRGGRGPAGAGCAVGGTVPAVVGRRPDGARRSPRPARMVGRPAGSGASRPADQRLRSGGRSAAPRSSRWWERRTTRPGTTSVPPIHGARRAGRQGGRSGRR